MIYKCEHCHKYFTDDEMESKEICLESEYGVSSFFMDRHYSLVNVCPYCGHYDELEEVYEYEVVELLNKKYGGRNERRK